MRYAAVVAAAGLSSRMHEFKPLLCLDDRTIIESVICNLRAANVGEIVVVVGYRAEVLCRHLAPLRVRTCVNPEFATTTMFESVLQGLRALREPFDRVFITPGDIPLVQPETLCKMQNLPGRLIRPICGGKAGHPILLDRECIPLIESYKGASGLRGAIADAGIQFTDLAVDDKGVLMDADTPEDFRMLRRQKMENRSGGQLWPDIQVHISKGDVILTPAIVQFLEMIDHTSSIQSACACTHMSYSTGWKLLNRIERELGYALVERYPGGSNGGGSCLSAMGRNMLDAYQRYRELMQTLSEELFKCVFLPVYSLPVYSKDGRQPQEVPRRKTRLIVEEGADHGSTGDPDR